MAKLGIYGCIYNSKGLQRKLVPLDYPPVKLGEAVNGNTILKIIDSIFYFAFYLER